MTTPWQLHHDQIRANEAALTLESRRAAHLADLRLADPAAGRRRRALTAFRIALRRYRTRMPAIEARQ